MCKNYRGGQGGVACRKVYRHTSHETRVKSGGGAGGGRASGATDNDVGRRGSPSGRRAEKGAQGGAAVCVRAGRVCVCSCACVTRQSANVAGCLRVRRADGTVRVPQEIAAKEEHRRKRGAPGARSGVECAAESKFFPPKRTSKKTHSLTHVTSARRWQASPRRSSRFRTFCRSNYTHPLNYWCASMSQSACEPSWALRRRRDAVCPARACVSVVCLRRFVRSVRLTRISFPAHNPPRLCPSCDCYFYAHA